MNEDTPKPAEQTPNKETSPTVPATTPAPTAVAAIPAVPEGIWPGAWGIYKYSRDAIRFNLASYLIVVFGIPFALGIVFEILPLPDSITSIISNLISIFLTITSTIVILASLRRTKIDFKESIKQTTPLLLLQMILLYIILSFALAFSFILFIIPFFIIFPRISLAPYFLIDQNLGINASISASWNMTKNNVGKVYGLVGATLAMALLMITIIGIPFSIYFLIMYSAAFPMLYMYLQKHTPPAASAAASPTPAAPAQ